MERLSSMMGSVHLTRSSSNGRHFRKKLQWSHHVFQENQFCVEVRDEIDLF